MHLLRILTATVSACVLCMSLSGAQSLTLIRTAAIADDDATTILYAIKSGAFKRAGLDVEFQALANGSAIAAGVIGGSIDIVGPEVEAVRDREAIGVDVRVRQHDAFRRRG